MSSDTQVIAPPTGPTAGAAARGETRRYIALGLWAAAVIAILVFALSTGGFASWDNVKAIFLASSYVGLLALAQMLVMTSGNFFSLSLGTVAVLAAMIFLSELSNGIVLAIVLAVAVAGFASAVQGLAVGAWRANPIIVTIGANAILTGLILLETEGAIIRPDKGGPSINWLVDPIGGIAFPFFVLVAATIVVQLVLRRTRFGLSVFLVGENVEAARAAALPITRTVVGVFLGAGILAALAGILLGASLSGATLSSQGTLPFDAIVATLIGGCAVAGGRGSAIGTFLGTLGVAAISSALLLRGYSEGVQILVKGSILLVVILAVHLWTSGESR
jgi:ribose/xylose/arabinose/galactoside ABC-type transport system permease subunit